MYDPVEHLRQLDAIIADLTRLERQGKWMVIGLVAVGLTLYGGWRLFFA